VLDGRRVRPVWSEPRHGRIVYTAIDLSLCLTRAPRPSARRAARAAAASPLRTP
jgi:hypothetical protein